MKSSLDILIQPARINFWAFCCYYDYEFFRIKRPFLYQIAEALQNISDKKIHSLAVSLPPRSGKSYIISLFAAWVIGNNPEGSVMRNCCTATLYNKFSYDTRDIVKSGKFKNVFPYIELSNDKTAVTGWNVKTAKQVTYFGNGVGGTIIGFGASLVAITDDLYKDHNDYFSETINDKILFWYDSAHGSRQENDCPIIDMGTRWGECDVIGTNIKKGKYDKIITVPALNDEGATFCDDVKSTQEYLDIKKDIDSFIWNSEYMQDPQPLEGLVFPEIKYYDELNDNEGNIIAYADTADEGTDYYAMPIAKLIAGKVYIIDVIFNQYNLDTNTPLLLSMIDKYNIDNLHIETNKEGGLLVKNLRNQTNCTIRGLFNTANKMSRIFTQSGFIMDNFYFKKNHSNPEYEKFISQTKRVMKTSRSNDDAPDALAGLAFIIRRNFLT